MKKQISISPESLHLKAKEYAKLIHQDEYHDPAYSRDVLECIENYKAGYKAAIENVKNIIKKLM